MKHHFFTANKISCSNSVNDAIFRKINSDLLKLTERFLIQVELERNEIDSRKYLLKQSYERNIEKLFNRVFNSLLMHLQALDKDEDYFFNTYWLWKSYWDFYVGKLNYSKMNECINNIEGKITGYSLIRRCRTGFKIGPLFADNQDFAEQLFFASNTFVSPGSLIYLDTPEVNHAAVRLAEKNGMHKVFETARMYTKKNPV